MKKTTKNACLLFISSFIALNAWMILANMLGVIFYKQKLGNITEAKNAVTSNTFFQMVLFITMELLLLWIVYLFVTKIEKQKFTASQINLQWEEKSVRHLLLGALVAIIISTGGWLTVLSFGYTSFQSISPNMMLKILLMTFYVAFAGIIEEILYRGYILKRLESSQGTVLALIISSAMFALSHIGRYPSIITLLFAFGMGMILGIMYIKTRSLYMPIGFHYIWDFLSKTIGDNKKDYSFVFKQLSENGIIVLTLGYLFCIIIGCIVLNYAMKKASNETSITS